MDLIPLLGYYMPHAALYAPAPGGGGGHAASIIMEDGTSYLLLENGTDSILKE